MQIIGGNFVRGKIEIEARVYLLEMSMQMMGRNLGDAAIEASI